MNPENNPGPRIGLLTLRMESGLSTSLWRGARREAALRDISLLAFPGTHLDTPEGPDPRGALNAVYGLASHRNLDGLIIWTSGLGNYISPDQMQEFCSSFSPLPLVLIGDPAGDWPRVDADAAAGFRQVVEHLIVHHGFSRIAYLDGPEQHQGSRLRLQLFRQILADHGLAADERLITPPSRDWWESPGNLALLLDQRGLVPGRDFQAIMAVSDTVAARAIKLLEERGIRVPEDVAVAGFDGEHLNNILVPQRITTTTLNLEEQGAAAVRLLDEQLGGKTPPPLTLVRGKHLVMDSCGCPPALPPQARDPRIYGLVPGGTGLPLPAGDRPPGRELPSPPPGAGGPAPDQPPQVLLARQLRGEFGDRADVLASSLCGAFDRAIAARDPAALVECIGNWNRHLEPQQTGPGWSWHGVVNRLKAVKYTGLSQPEDFRLAVWLMDSLAVHIHMLEDQGRNYRIGVRETQLNFLRDSQQWFMTTLNNHTLGELLPTQLMVHDIQTCAIMLYHHGQGRDSPVTIMFNLRQGLNIPTDPSQVHPPGTLYPPDWQDGRRRDYLVISLFFHNRPYGFMVFEAAPKLEEYLYFSLATMVNNPLWGIILLKERDERERELFLAKETAERERRKAEEATMAKSAFLATMSHELRTPLTAILGLSSLLMDSNLDSRQYQYVQTIRSSGDVLLGIISDILDFSKIEAGKLELEVTEYELVQLAESCMDLFGLRCSQKGIDQYLHIQKNLPRLFWGDTTRIRQVLVNLLNNAVKFTDSGRITLMVKTWDPAMLPPDTDWPVSQAGSINPEAFQDLAMVHFCVCDTGIGIKPEHQTRLFESFSQGDPSTTRKYGGSGLGLTISQKLVQLMGGTLWLQSSGVPGEGSSFHFVLPLRVCTVAPPAQPAECGSLAGKRILIIHQDPHMLGHLENCLDHLPLSIQSIPSPRNGLRHLLRATDPRGAADLLVLDSQMRDFQGLEFLTMVRRQARYRNIPAVFLVHLNDLPARVNRKSVVYCTKPVRRSSLVDALNELFSHPDAIINRKHQPPKTFDHDLARNCPMRILLAEDNQVNQMLILALLERFGYSADCARDGKEAINKASRKMYDLVLMDVQMPEIDGIEAARFLNSHLRPSWRPRIIAITANALQDDKQRCFEAGMKDYISKPIQNNELERVIRETWDLMPARLRKQRGGSGDTIPAPSHSKSRSAFRPLLAGLDPQVVDIATLGNLFELLGNPRTVREMIQGYLNQSREYLTGLDHALQHQDAAEGHRCAHSLKSGSYTLGAKTLGDLSKTMETCLKAGQFRELPEVLELATKHYKAVSDAFSLLLERMDKNS